MALTSGLTSPSVARLKKLWSSVGKSNPKVHPIQELINMTAETDNYKALRAEMSKSKCALHQITSLGRLFSDRLRLPYLPCLRPYLEELLRIEESHALFGQESQALINYAKARLHPSTLSDSLIDFLFSGKKLRR